MQAPGLGLGLGLGAQQAWHLRRGAAAVCAGAVTKAHKLGGGGPGGGPGGGCAGAGCRGPGG